MGAALAKAAYAAAERAGVDHAPARLYVFMALTARDADPLPVFYGGRDALVSALGAKRSTNGYKAAERVMSALRAHGLVSTERAGAPGRNTRYRLLDGSGVPLSSAPRSAWGDEGTPPAERPVNNSEHPTLSVQTPHAQRPEHPMLSVGLRKREEEEEEGRASAPPRTCRRHASWEHSDPCRACAVDRRAAEAWSQPRRPGTMSPRRKTCEPGSHRRLADGTCILCEDRDPLGEIA